MIVKTPPMGWNSWNTFAFDISEKVVMETADAIVERGLKDAGYEYVVIDDCWAEHDRGPDGRIAVDKSKFPNGMKYLSDYVHSKGLKFGMYSSSGVYTCCEFPASFDHEYLDAQMFADFGVDYLKYDYCNKPDNINGALLYRRMGMALKATGRDIVFSACNWGCDDSGRWMRSTGAHLYRSTGDISDTPNSFKDIANSQIMNLCYSAPGCFNDIDMLICGMYNKGNVATGGCTANEYKMHFALWCMMGSPLLMGCDVRNVDEDTITLLKNKDLIAIDQDEEQRPAFPVSNCMGNRICLFKHLANGEYALALFNFEDYDIGHNIMLFDIGLTSNSGYGLSLEEIFTGEKIEKVTDLYRCYVKSHDCKVFKAKVVKL